MSSFPGRQQESPSSPSMDSLPPQPSFLTLGVEMVSQRLPKDHQSEAMDPVVPPSRPEHAPLNSASPTRPMFSMTPLPVWKPARLAVDSPFGNE